MRALRMVGWKRDPELAVVPTPAPGPGEVLVRVGGAGVCHSDIHVLYEFEAGMFDWPIPFTLGHETAGWVEAVGPGADAPPPGSAVAVFGPWGCGFCRACLSGAENNCAVMGAGAVVSGFGRDGGMAEHLLLPTGRYLVPLPAGLTPADAAPLTDAGLTPYHAIRRANRLLRPGAVIVVIGAGGLGHLAIQILKAISPVTVVAIDAKQDALKLAQACGAEEALLAGEAASDRVRELTQGRGADAVFDFVANDATLASAGGMVASDGHIGMVGAGYGTIPVSMTTVPFGVSVVPTYWGTRADLAEVLQLAADGHLDVRTEQFGLSDAPKAYAAVREGRVTGRAVVVPD